MKVSIIVPVYNAAPYLRDCIDSLVGQTWKDIEVILVNDGSTDESGAICESYLNDPRVIYHYQENAGVSTARNVGLELATGDYVCFADADDWLELDAFEKLQNETTDIVIYNFYCGDNKHCMSVSSGLYNPDDLYGKMIGYVDETGNVVYLMHNIWMRMYKRSLLEKYNIRFYPQFHNGEDLLFTTEATVRAKTIAVRCDDYLYHYRPVQNSLTTSYVDDYWSLRKKIIEEMYRLLPADVMQSQMPLRVFLWVTTGIKNELRYANGKKENIRIMIADPVCDVFKEKLDLSKLNSQNQIYYKQICSNDTNGLWRDYKRQVRRDKQEKTIKQFRRMIKKILKG